MTVAMEVGVQMTLRDVPRIPGALKISCTCVG